MYLWFLLFCYGQMKRKLQTVWMYARISAPRRRKSDTINFCFRKIDISTKKIWSLICIDAVLQLHDCFHFFAVQLYCYWFNIYCLLNCYKQMSQTVIPKQIFSCTICSLHLSMTMILNLKSWIINISVLIHSRIEYKISTC